MEKRRLTTYQLALTALMTAFLCILGPWTIVVPVSPVPVSLASLAVSLTVVILGQKAGTLSCLLYLLIGILGVPVFSGFGAGVGKLLGPTGGYLNGYLLLAWIAGFFADRFAGNRLKERLGLAVGLILGTLLLYGVGTLWLGYVAQLNFSAALAAGVLPFLPGDFIKLVLALILGPQIRHRLSRAGLLR